MLFAFVVLWWYKARMDIKEFTEGVKAVGGADAVEKFAISCGTTGQYLSQIVRGHKTAGPEVCAQVHIMSGYRVSLHSMRPDIYPKESMTHDPLQK